MENQNLNILDEVNKGTTMGMNAISYVSEKVTVSRFNIIDLFLQAFNVVIIILTTCDCCSDCKRQCPEKHYPNKIFLHNYLKITLIIYY